eukprot:g17622.t1
MRKQIDQLQATTVTVSNLTPAERTGFVREVMGYTVLHLTATLLLMLVSTRWLDCRDWYNNHPWLVGVFLITCAKIRSTRKTKNDRHAEPRETDVTTPRPEKKQRTEPPQKEEESKKETAQEFMLVRRGDAGSSNPEWCAQLYGCIAYFNEKARDEDALQELIAPLLKESAAGTAVKTTPRSRAARAARGKSATARSLLSLNFLRLHFPKVKCRNANCKPLSSQTALPQRPTPRNTRYTCSVVWGQLCTRPKPTGKEWNAASLSPPAASSGQLGLVL